MTSYTPLSLNNDVSSGLIGNPLAEGTIQSAAQTARDEIDPPGDIDTPPDYQRFLAYELTIQALQQAAQNAGEGQLQERGAV